jgi:hypothetical protein
MARATFAAGLAQLQAGLRSVRADELVRLGVREREVGRELARLADACFDQAITFCDRTLRGGHRGRYRVSRRPAAALRGSMGAIASSQAQTERYYVRPAMGAPGVDQGARVRRRSGARDETR